MKDHDCSIKSICEGNSSKEKLISDQTNQKSPPELIRQLSSINAFGNSVTQSLSTQQVVSSAFIEIDKIFSPDIYFVFEKKDNFLNPLIIRSKNNFDDDLFKNHHVGECLCGLASRGDTVISPNIHEDNRCTLKECKVLGLKSLIVVPLQKRESVIGVMGIGFSAETDFNARIDFIEAIAAQLSTGLANAFLHEEMQKIMKEQECTLNNYKKIKSDIHKNESLLNSIFKAAPVGIGLVENRVFKWANDRLSEITGYSKDELKDQSSRMLYPSDEEYEYVGREKYKQIQKDGTGSVETKWQKKDGTQIDVFLSSTPLDPQDLSAGVTFTVLDITHTKKQQSELKRAKDEWERSFDSIQDIVTIQDKDMCIVRANKAACRFFKKEFNEILGMHCYELFRGIKKPCDLCPIIETLEDYETHSSVIEHNNLGKIFHVSSSPIFDEKGELIHLIHVAKDFTSYKKMEEDLFQAHKMEAVGTLAGGIAHDFNNILSAVIGYSELAKLNIKDPHKAESDINEVLKAGTRAQNLVKQILSFSRKGEEKFESFDPYLVVKETLKLLRSSIPTTIQIQEEIDINTGGIIADPTNIQQILMNLCTNALHSMESEQGVLKVSLLRKELSTNDVSGDFGVFPGSFMELSVSDTGHGIEKERLVSCQV